MKKLKPEAKKLGDVKGDKNINLGLPNPPLNNLQVGEHYKSLFEPEYTGEAERLIAAGFTEKDLAYTFNVPHGAVDSWKRNIPAFKAACVEGKKREKKRLVAKALLSAVGYDYETSKVKTHKDKEGNTLKIEETKFKNHQPANHNLLMFILCNIDHQLGDKEWFSKHKLEIDETKNIKVTIDGKLATEQITQLAGKILSETE